MYAYVSSDSSFLCLPKFSLCFSSSSSAIWLYIYIYIKREREREDKRKENFGRQRKDHLKLRHTWEENIKNMTLKWIFKK